MGKSEPLLRVHDLAFGYRNDAFLTVDSFALAAGEIVGVVGPNGAGKSTFLRLLGGVLEPTRGEIHVAGHRLNEIGRREVARRVAAMAQDTVVEFPFSVVELVLMGRTPYSRGFGFESSGDLARAHAAMRRVGVESLAGREVHELSGGERQRVVLARVLAQEAEVLLLDEPSAYLDLNHETRVFGLLRELAGEGKGIVVVLHDLNLAAACCDRLVLLSRGRLRASGPPAEVLTVDLIREVYEIAVGVEMADDGALRIVREWPRSVNASG